MKSTSISKQTLSRLTPIHKGQVNKILHQVWKSFFIGGNINYKKILKNVRKKLEEGENPKQIFNHIMNFHTSTKERMTDLEGLYQIVFEKTGKPHSILDIGCGFNPLTTLWMDLPAGSKYHAIDIDINEISFFDELFSLIPTDFETSFEAADAFEAANLETEKYDVVFMFKLLPVLELQEKGSVLKILKEIKSKFIVISFPTRSLSGKNVGMKDFYAGFYEPIFQQLDRNFEALEFPNELVYILH